MFDPALDAAPAPHEQVIEPRFPARQHTPDHTKRPKKRYDDLKLVFDFHIPFTSQKKDKKAKKPKKDPRPDDRMGPPEYIAIPPELRHPPPPMGYPGLGMRPVPHPPPPPPHHGLQVNQHPEQVTPPIPVFTHSSTNSSPSPLSPIREHNRRARSLSLTRQYEERKRVIQEQERREHAERIALAENAARRRAEKEAERIREERDRERRRNDALRAGREAERIRDEMDRERRHNDELRAHAEKRSLNVAALQRRLIGNAAKQQGDDATRKKDYGGFKRRKPVWGGSDWHKYPVRLGTQQLFIITIIITITSVMVLNTKLEKTSRIGVTNSSTRQSELNKGDRLSKTGTGQLEVAHDVAAHCPQAREEFLMTTEGGGEILEAVGFDLHYVCLL
ncbi:MAG: hypothetical protein Q9207_003272, partial [Kuettlingeria erythrocarpa]